MGFWQRCLVNALVFLATAGFFPMLCMSQTCRRLLAAIVLGLLNMSVKPILLVLSLPITVVTLGIFYLIINGLMLELTSVVMGGLFQFSSFTSAFMIAIVLSIVNLIITDHLS